MSQLQRALPPKMHKKLLDRIADLEVRKAGIENLHQCPKCDYMAEIENQDEKIFKCMNPECGKETCVLCKEESHIPLRCDEVEKKEESDFRKSVEERLSEVLVRICPKCKGRYLKADGCNKIACQCGALLCYVCRELIPPKVGYNHFCAHTRSPMPMGACGECKKCYLFLSDTAAEDDRLVEAARAEAEARAKQENPNLAAKIKEIGGKSGSKPVKKKRKTAELPVGVAAFGGMWVGGYQAMVGAFVPGGGDDDSDSDSDEDRARPIHLAAIPRAPVRLPPAAPPPRPVRRAPVRKRKR